MAQADKDIIAEALERFAECEEFESTQRQRMREELKFAAGEQWPERVKNARENDPNGSRPCLTMDKLGQYIRQVVNDSRQNKPAIKVRPDDSYGDIEVADLLQGVCRHIEDASCADVAYDTAIDHAAKIGIGYIRITTKVTDEASNQQEIEILPVHNVFSCLLDPNRRMPDGSDAEFGFVVDDIPRKRFERDYPRSKSKGWDKGDHQPGWSEKDTIRVCEYFRIVKSSENVLVLDDETEIPEAQYWELYAADENRPQIIATKVNTQKRVEWFKLTSTEILDRTEIPCRYIPIVEVIGNEHWIDGKRQLTGMVFWGQDAQRAYNYARSAFVEQVSLAPKAPFVAAAGQIEDFENEWRSANVSNQAVLVYNPIDVNGTVIPSPQRQLPPQPSSGWQAEMQISQSDIQSALGMYQASIGATSNEKSGRAILARQKEGDTSTFHYVDNLSRSIRQCGRILVDMIPRVYDTRRVVRIVGLDGETGQATIDPQMPQPFAKARDAKTGKIRKIFNPTLGKYDVTVTVGPSYNTRRMESADAMVEFTRANPNMFPLIGDLMVRAMDWPDADAIADRLKAILPPEIKATLETDDEQSPEVAQAVASVKQQYEQQLQMMIPQVEQMQQALQQAQQENQQLQQAVEGKQMDAQIKGAELQIKSQENQTQASLSAAELELKAREVAIKEQEAEIRRLAEENRRIELMVQAQATQEQPEAPESEDDMQEVSALGSIAQVLASLAQQVAAMQQQMAIENQSDAMEERQPKTIEIVAPSGAVYRGMVS